MPRETAASKTSKVPRTFKSKKSYEIFLATSFVDTVPGGDVNNAIAATKYVCQLRPVQNGPLDKHRFLFQIPWRTNIQARTNEALS
jgi:hypothetical protein